VVLDSRKDPVLSRTLDEFLQVAGVEIVPVTVEQARIARDAYRDFGKGSGHLAQLNFGDCFSYALAKANTEPLLYVGLDFSHTDVAAARIQ
jgi:ribonuclease VapC